MTRLSLDLPRPLAGPGSGGRATAGPLGAARRAAMGRLDLRLTAVVSGLVLIGFGVSLGDDFHLGLSDGGAGLVSVGPRALLEGAAVTLPLVFRRVAPVAVFCAVASASLINQGLNHHPEPLPLAVLVALYTVVILRRSLVGVLVATGYLALLVMASFAGWVSVPDEQYYIDSIAVVGTVSLGYGVALSRAKTRLAEERTDEMARSAEARAREAVEREQARIAREMHDILTHHLSVIVAQSAAARRVYPNRPEAAVDALASIESVSREALTGLRRLVGLLRVDVGLPERSPQPGLDRLEALVEQVRRAGLEVDLVIRGHRRPLPADLEVNAFRLVQEALTNVLRHAGRTCATVTLAYGEDTLDLDVVDEGAPGGSAVPPTPATNGAPAGGYGLISMQQRVALLGGELSVGPVDGRGFRVRARLPVDARGARTAAVPG